MQARLIAMGIGDARGLLFVLPATSRANPPTVKTGKGRIYAKRIDVAGLTF